MLYVSHNHHRNDFVDPTGISKLVKIHLLDTRIMAAVACLFSRDEVVFLRHAEFALRGEFTLHHADEVFVMGNGYMLKVCLCGSSGECLFVSLSYCFLLCVFTLRVHRILRTLRGSLSLFIFAARPRTLAHLVAMIWARLVARLRLFS